MSTFAAHQVNFMPYLGYWVKMDRADTFGHMPDVQFVKREYQNRVKVGWDGYCGWLTVPVVRGPWPCAIECVEVHPDWKSDLVCRRLQQLYGKRPFWGRYGKTIQEILSDGHDKLVELNLELINYLVGALEITTKLVVVRSDGASASDNLARWATEAGADVYLSGLGGKNYLDQEAFVRAGVRVIYNECEIAYPYKTVSVLSALMDRGPGWRELVHA